MPVTALKYVAVYMAAGLPLDSRPGNRALGVGGAVRRWYWRTHEQER